MTTGSMPVKLPDKLRSQLSEFVAARLGLHFPKQRWGDLERGVRAAAQEDGDSAVDAYLQRLLTATPCSDMVAALANHLTVGETYFFRERRSFDQLEEKVMHDVIGGRHQKGRHLNIWSAGCATGEEPYSVAILLSRMIPDLKDWKISILATDLNSRSLQKAGDGVYSGWSFRSTPAWIRSAYFTVTSDGLWAIVPDIKKMVRFARLNLVADDYTAPFDSAGTFDVILCRNVLMYFTPEAARRAVCRLHGALAPGGWLIVGYAETSHALFSEFDAVGFPESAIYRKLPGERSVVTKCSPARSDKTAALPGPHLALARPGEPEAVSSETSAPIPAPSNRAAEAALKRARLLADQRRLREALGWCDSAIRIDKMDADSHYLRAAILQEQGFFEEASLALRRAIYANPEFVLAHFALGSLAMRQRRPKISQKCFENALDLLRKYQQEDVLPSAHDLTAGRLSDWARRGLEQVNAMGSGELAEAIAQCGANRGPSEATFA